MDVGRVHRILTLEPTHDMNELAGTTHQFDKGRTRYGFLPLMASSCDGQTGALNVASFAERIISGGNLTMDDENIQLNHGGLGKLVVLRINRDFVLFMRENYANAIKSSQPWNMTVVDP